MYDDIPVIIAAFLLGGFGGAVLHAAFGDAAPYKGPDVEHHYFQVPVPYCNKPEERVS